MILEEPKSMNINLIIKTKNENKKLVKVRFRLSDGRQTDLWVKSDILVDIRYWDFNRECYKNIKACPYTLDEQKNIKDQITKFKMLMEEVYLKCKNKNKLTSKSFNQLIQNNLKFGSNSALNMDIIVNLMSFYIKEKNFSVSRTKSVTTLLRSINRFENFISSQQEKEIKLMMTDVNHQLLRDFRRFMHKELDYIELHPELYTDKKLVASFKTRSENYVEDLLIRFRSFWNWCIDEGRVSHNPFVKFDIIPPVYNEPIVMTKNELRILVNAKLNDERLEIVRDYLLFCSSIGCRPGEAALLTKSNIVSKEEDGVITKNVVFFQRKGARKHITKIDNPLNQVALNIVNKYYFSAGESLLPKISMGNYNKLLKVLFKTIGLTREISHFDRRTGEERFVTLDSVATAYLGRRNFLSAVVNSGVDKAIYTKMSGHKINTPHLSRYIEVSNDTKKNVVDLICPEIEDKFESDYFNKSIS